MAMIHGPLVKKFREKKRWTQRELAKKAKLDTGTVSRIERQDRGNVRGNTLANLLSALDVSVGDLVQSRRPEVERDVMKLNVGNAARNALSLVALRYGVSRSSIVEAAPLLFFLVAEQSLRDRQRHLDALRDAQDSLFNLQWEAGHLPVTAPLDDMALGAEQESINDRDLFGNKVIDDADSFLGVLSRDFDDAVDNPLSRFVRNIVTEINDPDSIDGDIKWRPHGGPQYQVCLEEARELVDGDEEAVAAILSGVAPLHEMPKGKPSERADWARRIKEEDDRKWQKFFGELDDEFSRPESEGPAILSDGVAP